MLLWSQLNREGHYSFEQWS